MAGGLVALVFDVVILRGDESGSLSLTTWLVPVVGAAGVAVTAYFVLLRRARAEEVAERPEQEPPRRSVALQQAVWDCDRAYANFFASLKGQREGRRVQRPRFRSRKDRRQAIRRHTGGFSIRPGGKLRLAKVGDVAVAWSRDLPSAPSSVTAARNILAAGRVERVNACGAA